VIEGVYPDKPKPSPFVSSSAVYVAGNEGLAQITEVGDGVDGLGKGDWVVMAKQQCGTWATALNMHASDVVHVTRKEHLKDVHAATMTVRLMHVCPFNIDHEMIHDSEIAR